MTITSTNNYSGDTFNASLAPARSATGPGSFEWWCAQDKVTVLLQMGWVGAGADESQVAWITMLTGIVDHVSSDPIQGTVDIDGRDLTALLRDSERTVNVTNQTTSEVATAIATSVGLTPVVTATTTQAGKSAHGDYGQAGLKGGNRAGNNWDALVELARQDGFDLFVQGNELHYQPPAAMDSPPWVVSCVLDPATRVPKSNAINLTMNRKLFLASGVQVSVRSFHSQTAELATAQAGSSDANARQYSVVRPNLTNAQAQTLAQRYVDELMRHERTITGSAPGDLVLTPRVMMSLAGTRTPADQSYYPLTITRTIDSRGFVMQFLANNRSREAQALADSQGTAASAPSPGRFEQGTKPAFIPEAGAIPTTTG